MHVVRSFRLIRALFACVCAGGSLCAASAQGQGIREGYPTKGVLQEESYAAPGGGEACGPFEVPDAFGEGCTEERGADAAGTVAGAGAFPNASPAPALFAPPRIECPAAVFVEELETGVIECRASDEAGEEHLEYRWEPAGGAPRDYMDAPRLIGEDRLAPSIVAPSSPFHDTLESFLSEEATLRYRYRLTAASRVTGLASQEEVEVFVLLRRPSVYCPLEYEIPAGAEIVLSCEGADPLSFRMDYEAGSSVSWKWEGLWGSSVSLLGSTDASSPSFRAPLEGAGETHHYVASMTTTSSGVPRTARRRVSVTVVEGEAEVSGSLPSLSTGGPPPTIACTDIEVYPNTPAFPLDCSVKYEPPGARYRWTETGGPKNSLNPTNVRSPLFLGWKYTPLSAIPDEGINHEYKASMLDSLGAEVASDLVTITVLGHPDLMKCVTEYEVYAGDPDLRLECDSKGHQGLWVWAVAQSHATQNEWRRVRFPLTSLSSQNPLFRVPKSLSPGKEIEYFKYLACFVKKIPHPASLVGNYEIIESEYITVTVKKKLPEITVACAAPSPVYEGSPDIALSCKASEAPPGSDYAYAWTARGSTPDTKRLTPKDVLKPTFDVPAAVDKDETYEYLLTVSADNAKDGKAEVTITVLDRADPPVPPPTTQPPPPTTTPPVPPPTTQPPPPTTTPPVPPVAVALTLTCAAPAPVYEGADDITLSCKASEGPGNDSDYTYAWEAQGAAADTDLLSATDISSPMFYVPAAVEATTRYEYRVTASAANAEPASEEVTVTVLDKGALALMCANPAPVYEGAPNIALSCEASDAPEGSSYEYVWEARGAAANADLLSATDISSPTFMTPEDVSQTTRYEYRVTVSADNAEDTMADVTVTVLDRPTLALTCADPEPVYEGSPDIDLSCEASGAPDGSSYEYAWEAQGAAANADLLSATNTSSPTFATPEEVSQTTRYEYKVTASADNAEDATADVTVTVLDKPSLALTCADPEPVYEGSPDIDLSCEASGAPDGSFYEYAWEALDAAANADLLSATNTSSPTFATPEEVSQTTRYEYKVTASADNAEDATVEVAVTVLDKPSLALTCADPEPVYEGSPDIDLSCEASGAPDGSSYEYAWEAQGAAANADLLSATNTSSPTFATPEEVSQTTRYEYRVTVSAENAEDAAANVTVTVLNKGALTLTCAAPAPVYEGSPDIDLSCEASGAPDGSSYEYAWEAQGAAADTDLLSATDISSPTFYVPDAVDATTGYEYRVTVSAENAEDATANVTVTVLNKGALTLTCAAPAPVYEGSPDIDLSCEASGAPDGSSYEYAWEAQGAAADTDLLSATDISSPTFYVPDAVDATTGYEYRVTVSADNAEDATAEVTVTVLDRPEPPAPPSAIAFAADPTGLGIAVSVSSLRFGVQSADAQVSLDPLTDRLSTRASGPRHAGRMTLSLDGDLALGEDGEETTVSIELVASAALRHESGASPPLVLAPRWSYASSCDQLASESISGSFTQATLSESGCRLFLFGGDLDLTGAAPGRYSGNIEVVLRAGAGEETRSVEATVTVAASRRVIAIGPGGARFDASREVPAVLSREQSLTIYPDMAFMTREAPHGVFELSNTSLVPLEASVSARFGYAEATEDGRETVAEDKEASLLGDLSEIVAIHPQFLTLAPGERAVVRYGVRAEALSSATRKGYAAFFEIASSPRLYARSDRLPEGTREGGTARATLRVPGAYAPGGAARLSASLLSLSEGASPAATFLIETNGVPFAGEAVAYDGQGRELGRSGTLVYTRSRVRMRLERLPEGEAVFLRFTPRGSVRAAEPAVVPWRAPQRERRDIGAALDDGKTPSTAALAERP